MIALKHRVASVGFKFTERNIPRKLRLAKLKQQGIASGSHFNALQKGHDVEYQGQRLYAQQYTFYSWRPSGDYLWRQRKASAAEQPR